ncbi:MAG: hypothetical protein J6S67_04455 [Methanobrevibacter sp.]|nr:hypothetical protein [Methanobrevibacter sp.]
MHKLIEYVCEELEKIEQQAGTGKLSIAEIEYADKLAHLKKNLLRAEELMEEGYSGEVSGYPMSFRGGRYSRRGSSYEGRGSSYDERGRGSNAQRDSRGRYSSRGGRGGYSRYVRDDYSMDSGEVVEDLRDLMEQAPDERLRQEIKRIITKVEQMDD